MIYLASDHAGFELKEKIKNFLACLGYETKDFGSFEFNPEDDYPDFINPIAEQLQKDIEDGMETKAVIFGFSGQGEAICANRHKKIRAAVFYGGSKDVLKLSREHNDANILSIGAGFILEGEAEDAIKLWLHTPFPNGSDANSARHLRRIEKLE